MLGNIRVIHRIDVKGKRVSTRMKVNMWTKQIHWKRIRSWVRSNGITIFKNSGIFVNHSLDTAFDARYILS